jgi:hypothetical protein
VIGAAAGPTADQIPAVALAAGRAPSVHNTQPWRLTVRGGDLYLSADPDRRLPAADPDGREMIISCGAALYNMVLALRDLGHRPAVRLLPDTDYPHRLAVVHPAGGADPVDGDGARCAAIPVRRTHRGAFDGTPVPAGLLRRLRAAAHAEEAELIVFDAEADVRVLATTTELASYMHIRDGAYAAEHARWMRTEGSARADGIHPARLADPSSTGDPLFPPRFVDTTRPPKPGGTWPVGTVALIATDGDDPRHWLHAGMAMQRILLDLTAAGFTAALHTQPLEIPHLRDFVAGEFAYGRPPHVLLRMGRAPDGGEAVPSIRRPVADFLTWGAA